jgi:hypothetical protein
MKLDNETRSFPQASSPNLASHWFSFGYFTPAICASLSAGLSGGEIAYKYYRQETTENNNKAAGACHLAYLRPLLVAGSPKSPAARKATY